MWKSHIDQLIQMDDSQQKKPTEEMHSDKEAMIQFPLNEAANDTEPVNDESVTDSIPTLTGILVEYKYIAIPPDRITHN